MTSIGEVIVFFIALAVIIGVVVFLIKSGAISLMKLQEKMEELAEKHKRK